MIAHVVPVVRLRRATTWWSYRIPPGLTCVPGSLVRIPFRGRSTLGVIWDIAREDADAREEISAVLTKTPLVRRPSRNLVDWLAQAGCTSLSTALYVWLPASLRKNQPAASTLSLLQEYDRWQEHDVPEHPAEQHLYLVPGIRPQTKEALQRRFGASLVDTFTSGTETQELHQWFSIAMGRSVAVYGRERALFSPFLNLHQVMVQEIEDISYFHEQTPYLSLIEAAEHLVTYSNAVYEPRSWLPPNAATALWGTSVKRSPKSGAAVELLDLHGEPLLNERLIARIQSTLDLGERVAVLYNAHDRRYPAENGDEIVLPGFETLRRKLIRMLSDDPGDQLVFDTRALLANPPKNVGLSVILSLDPLIRQSVFADMVHGWSDITRMAALGAQCIAQSQCNDHPLVNSLRNSMFDDYCTKTIKERQSFGLPPFGTTYACTIELGKTPQDRDEKIALYEPEARQLASSLQKLMGEQTSWKCSHPVATTARSRSVLSLFIHTSQQDMRLPVRVYSTIASLKRPWKVTRNPWYLL